MGKITLQIDSSPFDGKPMEMSINLPDIYVAEKMDELLNYTKGMKMYPTTKEQKGDDILLKNETLHMCEACGTISSKDQCSTCGAKR